MKINSRFLQKLGRSAAVVMGFNYAVRDAIRIVWKKCGFLMMDSCPWFVEAVVTTAVLLLIARVWNRAKCKYTVLERTNI